MNGATISPEYLAQQRRLHENTNYGVASLQYAPIIAEVVPGWPVASVSDYGAGKCRLLQGIVRHGFSGSYYPYDPAFPEMGDPQPAELVCCIDALEHVEPAYLGAVLADLERITVKLGFFSIHCGPAMKKLPDGRNAHLIQEPPSWWLPKLCQHFEIERMEKAFGGFWVLVKAKIT